MPVDSPLCGHVPSASLPWSQTPVGLGCSALSNGPSVGQTDFSGPFGPVLQTPPGLGCSALSQGPSAGQTDSSGHSGPVSQTPPGLGCSALSQGPSAGQTVVGDEPTPKRCLPRFEPTDEEKASRRYIYDASPEVNAYVEKYFRAPLADGVLKGMLSADPRPDTPAMVVPTVDESVVSWMGEKFPKSADGTLVKLQQSLLSASGPLTQLWEDILHNEEASSIPCDVVLDAVQRSLVLLGHVNAKLSAHRRAMILEASGHKNLVKVGREAPTPSEGSQLFGEAFFKDLSQNGEDKKTLTKVTSSWTSKRRDRSFNSQRQEGFHDKPWKRRSRAQFEAQRSTSRFSSGSQWGQRNQQASRSWRTTRPNWRKPPTSEASTSKQ